MTADNDDSPSLFAACASGDLELGKRYNIMFYSKFKKKYSNGKSDHTLSLIHCDFAFPKYNRVRICANARPKQEELKRAKQQ